MSRHTRRRPFCPAVEALEARAVPSVCTVDRLTDLDEGKAGRGSLRYCVTESLFRADTIDFEVTGVINLTRALPNLTRSVSIEGPGAELLTVRRDTGGDYRIFTIADGATVSLSGLTIANGNDSVGGGIGNSGALTVSHSTISGNRAVIGGAGIATFGGTLWVLNSTISGNSTAGFEFGSGGGILNGFFGTQAETTIINSTVSSNSAGGGFTASGGGIDNQSGTLTVTNSTITGNSANSGMFPARGGGIGNSGTLNLRNTILAGNRSATAPDLSGSLTSSGYNLIGNTQGGSGFDKTDLLNFNPQLAPLQDNGGPTRTHALLPGSPALDAGDNVDAPEFDQRGLPRIVADTIDIGAFEVQSGPASWFLLEASAEVAAGVPFDVTLYALDDYGHLATGYEGTVTFTTTDKDPGVVLPAGYTFTADDQGIHTFAGETVLVTPGEQYLSAFDVESGAYGEAVVTVIPSGAPGAGGGWPRAVLDGAWILDLVFIPFRERTRKAL